MKKVIIIDDHPVILAGMSEIVNNHKECTVVATGDSADDILVLSQKHGADLVIVDLNMPGDVKTTLQRLQTTKSPPFVIVFTATNSVDECMSLMSSGANGYVVKGVQAGELYDAISSVLSGDEYITGSLAAKIMRVMHQKEKRKDKSPKMTIRENQIVNALMDGATNREIAQKLDLSENTIKFYMSKIMQKFNAKNRLEVVLAMKRDG